MVTLSRDAQRPTTNPVPMPKIPIDFSANRLILILHPSGMREDGEIEVVQSQNRLAEALWAHEVPSAAPMENKNGA